MKFFEECRPEFFFHGARLVRDKKTGRRSWRLCLVITLEASEVLKCDEGLQGAYQAIETRSNRLEDVTIGGIVPLQAIEFYALADAKAPALTVKACDLTGLRMTRVDGLTELWINIELENSDALHLFVRDFAFSRLWAQFSPAQAELIKELKAGAAAAVHAALDKLTAPLRSGECESITISPARSAPVTLTKEDAERIHARLPKD